MKALYDLPYYRDATNSRDMAQQDRKPSSDIGAPRMGNDLTGRSDSPSPDALNTLPFGNLTNSSPLNEATKLQPGGKEAASGFRLPELS